MAVTPGERCRQLDLPELPQNAEYGWPRDGISLFSCTHILAGYADPLVAW
jgi:hypothetical protein